MRHPLSEPDPGYQEPEELSINKDEFVCPEFTLCGVFTGRTDQPASQWLKKYEWEWRRALKSHAIPPSNFFAGLDVVLADEAANWFENTPGVCELADSPTEASVDEFKRLFTAQYPPRLTDPPTTTFYSEISSLKQGEDESALGYYQRGLSLLHRVGAKDRGESPKLSPMESVILDDVMDKWARGLRDSDVRKDTFRSLATPGQSLSGLYSAAVQAMRTKECIQKLEEEERKVEELQLYKALAQSIYPMETLESMFASYSLSGNLLRPAGQAEGLSHNKQTPAQEWIAQAPDHQLAKTSQQPSFRTSQQPSIPPQNYLGGQGLKPDPRTSGNPFGN
ncbi:hypothetical protein VTN02DRAFT_2260 [Thermoascus thermophilus]